jgi:hypothetical protein
MSQKPARGISRRGLDAAFEAEETRKSKLILEARLSREHQQDEDAADRFAQAAEIEERLSDLCEGKGLVEKALVHRFSAASCWAQAGNFYRAIMLCDDLLVRADLPDRLRERIRNYAQSLRERRSQWYEGLVFAAASVEG